MEKAVERVEALFQKADSDVNSLSQRLQFEFENNEDLQKTNPAELLSKISDIKQDYASVVKQVEDIQESQKEALDKFRGHLNDVCKLLLTLQTNTGTTPTEKPEELVRLEQFLGSDLPWNEGSDVSTMSSGNLTSMMSPSSEKSEELCTSYDTECKTRSSDSEMFQPQNRSKNEYMEVSEQEFESVSILVRGRVKLADVNSSYRVLWDHFRRNKDCKSLTLDEMHKLGLRVSGATGQAKLKVLRALKLLKLSNKGDVLEVC